MIRFARRSPFVAAVVSAVVGSALAASAFAAPVVIQPTGSAGRDAFVYSFLATGNFTTGFGGQFSGLLSTGLTSSGHNLETLVKFDLTGVSLAAGETATLNLFVGDTASAQFGVNPSAAFPVTTIVGPAAGTWAYDTVTWNTRPGASTPNSSVLVDGINKWVSMDVTAIVNGWVAGGQTNNGFSLRQDQIVLNGGSVVAVYNSSRTTANQPFLRINAVPEPGAMGLFAAAVPAALLRRRRA